MTDYDTIEERVRRSLAAVASEFSIDDWPAPDLNVTPNRVRHHLRTAITLTLAVVAVAALIAVARAASSPSPNKVRVNGNESSTTSVTVPPGRVIATVRGTAAGTSWRMDSYEGGCRLLTFASPLQPFPGLEMNAHAVSCATPRLSANAGAPLELLAVGRLGSRVIVAFDTDPKIRAVNVDGGPTLTPSAASVFVFVGTHLPHRVTVGTPPGGLPFSADCALESMNLPPLPQDRPSRWWFNCSYSSDSSGEPLTGPLGGSSSSAPPVTAAAP